MDSKKDFPLLVEPIDVYSLKDTFMAAFPNFLLIGYLIIDNLKTVFLENSYIKIPFYYYQDFFNALLDIGQFLIHEKDPNTPITTIFETETFQFQWTIENNLVYFKVNNHVLNKTNIEIDIVQYYYLVNGFKELFFKPFCLQYFINYSFYCISEVFTKSDIEKISLINHAVQATDQLQLNFKKEELLQISENILRYKNELILYFNLKNIIPPKPF